MDELFETEREKRYAVEAFANKVGYDVSRFAGPDDDSQALASALGRKGREHPQPGRDRAPGVLHSRGQQPLTLIGTLQVLRGQRPAGYETEISSKLARVLGLPEAPGRLHWVLDPDNFLPLQGREEEAANLATELKQAIRPATMDLNELTWFRRKVGLEGKAMDSLDLQLGGSLVPLPATGSLIEAFTARSITGTLPTTRVALPAQGAMQWPREVGPATAQWLGPNDAITDTTPTTGMMDLRAKNLGALVKLPNTLIRFATGTAEALTNRSMASQLAKAFDLAALEGAGGAHVPLGILKYDRSTNDVPAAGKVTLHNAAVTAADGDTLAPTDPLKMMMLVETADDPDGANGFAMRPMLWETIVSARADAIQANDSRGPFLFSVSRGEYGAPLGKTLHGLPVATSTQINRTSRKGSGTALTYLLCGNWAHLYVGMVAAIELAASDAPGFAADQTWVRAILRGDIGLAHPESMVIVPTLLGG